MKLIPVIMAGGSGSRLWPLSREHFPKQFLKLHGENSMLQETLIRLKGLDTSNPIVVCNEKHRFLVAEQLRNLDLLDNNIILEPYGRNTAPAITLAALNALRVSHDDDALLLVLAADHIIDNKHSFHSAIEEAINFASNGNLVTFGIVARSPETGYGYILRGEERSSNDSKGYSVKSFVEKPDLETAKSYISEGNYYWNSGMFLLSAKKFLQEMQLHQPEILVSCRRALENVDTSIDSDFIRVNRDIFESCPNVSVDYAIMEKTGDAIVIPLDAGWNDIGSWSALWEVSEKSSDNNVLIGDVINIDTNNCYVHTKEHLVATVGLENTIVITTKDATLVINKDKVQDVKKVVESLKASGRNEFKMHRESYRPWGHVDKIVNDEKYTVNRLTVQAGATLSYQKHYHRSEHWVVLKGTAKVILDGNEFLLTVNQSTFIPIGSEHRLENPGKIPLEILEIQSGDYLGPNDIVRF